MYYLKPKMLKHLRLIHRYVSFICAGLFFIYIISGFMLNHKQTFRFLSKKSEKTVACSFTFPEDKKNFSEVQARQFMQHLQCDTSRFERFTLNKKRLTIFGKGQLRITMVRGEEYATISDMTHTPFLYALNKLHRNPSLIWTITSDIFLILMMILLITGLLIVPGKKGLFGIGGILVLLGIIIPIIIYFCFV